MFKLNQKIKSIFGVKRVFLDYASSTPVRKEVKELMEEYQNFANPSALYSEALNAKEALTKARTEVAAFLNAPQSSIVFTSGGTEGNNIAILGVFECAKKNGINNPHIITVATEHPAVIEVCKEIENRGGEVTYLKVAKTGLVNLVELTDAVKENTVLISVMFVNNEIGTVQPIREIGLALQKIRESNKSKLPYFHIDACQAPLFYSLDVSTLGVDLLTLDGIKIYGPRGCGVLYVKTNTEISPVTFGGGQENSLRSGTENIVGAIGMAKALELCKKEKFETTKKVLALRNYFAKEIEKKFPDSHINGIFDDKHRSPNNLNICFQGHDAEYLVIALDVFGVSCSYSSSCRTLKGDSSSYVIEALDSKDDCKNSSLRFTLGNMNTKSEIDFAIIALKLAITQVRANT